jgi:flagellar biosynthesis protein FliQ
MANLSMNKNIVILGDILAIGLITLIGFATHGETGLSFLPRMAATFFPLVIAWFLLAPSLGLFRDEIIHNASQLWRPALTAVFAAPFAVVLRGVMLNAAIIPIFAIVLGAASALGMAVWRALYFLLNRKTGNEH